LEQQKFPENYLNNKILQNKLGDFKAEKVSILKNILIILE
jgi:4-alpha-glucanotransferase